MGLRSAAPPPRVVEVEVEGRTPTPSTAQVDDEEDDEEDDRAMRFLSWLDDRRLLSTVAGRRLFSSADDDADSRLFSRLADRRLPSSLVVEVSRLADRRLVSRLVADRRLPSSLDVEIAAAMLRLLECNDDDDDEDEEDASSRDETDT